MPKVDYLPDSDGSFRLIAHLLASAIPERENFFVNKSWKRKDLLVNINFARETLVIGLYCAVSDNFETEKLRATILESNYKYLKSLNEQERTEIYY